MNTQKNSLIIGAIIVILVIVLAAVVYFRQPGKALAPTNVATSTNATSTISASSTGSTIVTTADGGSYTVTPIYASSTPDAPKAPSATTPLSFDASVSADTRASMLSQFADMQTALKANALDFDAWISLGDLRKAAGDYAGAAADWNYMSELYPTNVVSHANLADLYFHFAPDYAKAASEYQLAIKNDPTQIYLYDDFYQLYTDKYPAAGAALAATLKQGITANPTSADLKLDLARYYRASGDTTDAKTEYQAALTTAQSQGDTSLAATIQSELSAM